MCVSEQWNSSSHLILCTACQAYYDNKNNDNNDDKLNFAIFVVFTTVGLKKTNRSYKDY